MHDIDGLLSGLELVLGWSWDRMFVFFLSYFPLLHLN